MYEMKFPESKEKKIAKYMLELDNARRKYLPYRLNLYHKENKNV